jgi:hypothetical protein
MGRFEEDLAAFLQEAEVPDLWTWLLLPPGATPADVVARVQERVAWARSHHDDQEWASEVRFVLRWQDALLPALLAAVLETRGATDGGTGALVRGFTAVPLGDDETPIPADGTTAAEDAARALTALGLTILVGLVGVVVVCGAWSVASAAAF